MHALVLLAALDDAIAAPTGPASRQQAIARSRPSAMANGNSPSAANVVAKRRASRPSPAQQPGALSSGRGKVAMISAAAAESPSPAGRTRSMAS